MNTPIYYVDAFTEKLFAGNPAAVIFSDLNNVDLMQAIAAENNLSETAFVRTEKDTFYIRWFSPTCEIDLCGHATLASAYVYFNFINTKLSNGAYVIIDDCFNLDLNGKSIYQSLTEHPHLHKNLIKITNYGLNGIVFKFLRKEINNEQTI